MYKYKSTLDLNPLNKSTALYRATVQGFRAYLTHANMTKSRAETFASSTASIAITFCNRN